MATLVVTRGEGRGESPLVGRLRQDPRVTNLVAVDSPIAIDLGSRLEGAGEVIHVGHPATTGAVLAAAAQASVTRLVIRSHAAVYGAWADNQVPLTEDVPIRPNPGFSFAHEHAEAERLVAHWRDDHPGTTVAVLRLAPVVAPGGESWESRTLGRPSRVRRRDALPPGQFLLVDDAASALLHALTQGLDGTYNVAPDGFVAGATARALVGAMVLPLSEGAASTVDGLAWRLGWGGRPADAVPYAVHPWVVANDRLRATGWSPAHTNEEAVVAARTGSWWREMSPQQRQESTLALAGVATLGVGGGVVASVRALTRRRRRPLRKGARPASS